MRVVDLGTGTGEVALLVAELVGLRGVGAGRRPRHPTAGRTPPTKFADRGVTNIELVEADVASYTPDAAGGRGARPAGAVLPARPRRHHPAAARRARARAASTWRSSTTPKPCAAAPETPLVTRLSALMNAAFAAVGTPQTLGPHLAGMLREAGAADAQSLGLQAYLGPDDPLGPAMLAGVIGEPGPGDRRATGSRTRLSSMSPPCATRSRPSRRRPGRAMVAARPLVAAWGHPALSRSAHQPAAARRCRRPPRRRARGCARARRALARRP